MISFLHDLVFKDLWLKFFSLGLAVLIWFTVSLVIHKESLPVAVSDASTTISKIKP